MGRKTASAVPPNLTVFCNDPLFAHLHAVPRAVLLTRNEESRAFFRKLRSVFRPQWLTVLHPPTALCKQKIRLTRFITVFDFIGNCVFYKVKKYCMSLANARFTCSEMDESKTVAALRRSRFLVVINIFYHIKRTLSRFLFEKQSPSIYLKEQVPSIYLKEQAPPRCKRVDVIIGKEPVLRCGGKLLSGK